MATDPTQQPARHVPPHNLEAEQSVLGAMVMSPNAIPVVTEILQADDFYRETHRLIYRSILTLYAKGAEVDAVTLSAELEQQGVLEHVGGKAFIHTLPEIVPAASNARQYAEIVRETSVLRQLIQVGNEIAELGYQHPDETPNLLDKCEQKVFAISNQRRTSEFQHIKEILKQNFERIELLQRDSSVSGVASGFPAIDKITGGFQPSNLIVLAARPGMGKTSLALNIAHHVGVDGNAPVAIFSLEMSAQEIGERMICSAARVSSHKVRTAALSGDDYAKLVQVVGELEKADIFVDDSAGLNMFELRAKARRLAAKKPLGLLIVDYLQLMMGDGRSENRQQEVANISRSLKQLARELEIPVIAVSQLNRSPEVRQDKRPQLSDLRECLAGDTPVTLSSTGERVPIRDVAGERDVPVWSLNDRLQLGHGVMTEVWRTATKPVQRIKLASGREIRATENHPFLTVDGWATVSDLQVGAHLAVARQTPKPFSPRTRTEYELVLIAHLLGNGCVSRDPVSYCSGDPACLQVVEEAAHKLGVSTSRTPGRGVTYVHFPMNGPAGRGSTNPLYDLLRRHGLYGKRAHEKRIPAALHRLGDTQVRLFLRHLWATDGSVTTSSSGTVRIFYATTSRRLADDVQALLLRLGVGARLRLASSNHRPVWTVDVSGRRGQLEFLATIGVHGAREARCLEALDRLKATSSDTNVDAVPAGVWHRVRASMRTFGVTSRELARRLDMSYCGSTLYRSGVCRDRMLRVAHAVPDPVLMHLAISDVRWDRVAAIEPAGRTDVYDARVPGTHSFLANDIVSHNSGAIEQDADLVMFINADPKDETKRGTVEIIVAKHRNGPTGVARLGFVADYTRFRHLTTEEERRYDT